LPWDMRRGMPLQREGERSPGRALGGRRRGAKNHSTQFWGEPRSAAGPRLRATSLLEIGMGGELVVGSCGGRSRLVRFAPTGGIGADHRRSHRPLLLTLLSSLGLPAGWSAVVLVVGKVGLGGGWGLERTPFPLVAPIV
jgi:hypothetical protein